MMSSSVDAIVRRGTSVNKALGASERSLIIVVASVRPVWLLVGVVSIAAELER